MEENFSELHFDQFLCMNHTWTIVDETVYAVIVLSSTLWMEEFPFVVCNLAV